MLILLSGIKRKEITPLNNHLPLNKTNYFLNLKKKAASVKDEKEQIKVNKELLNCIDILCNRYEHLLKDHQELSATYNRFAESIGMYINGSLVPNINNLNDQVRKLIGEGEVEPVEEKKEDLEGGETMNA